MPVTNNRPLKVGIYLPHEEKFDGDTAGWDDLLAIARRAEEVGLDSIWLADHFLFKNKEGQVGGWWECCMLMAALAAATERVEIGTGVICTGYRNPALLAKMAETIDEISDGRSILGIGAGWDDFEYVAYGYPTDHKFSRFEEALQIIHPLLKTGRVTFNGEYYQAENCELRPRGPRSEGPPIMIAATGDKMLDLTARYADMWNGWLRYDPEAAEQPQELLGKLDAACAAVGRNPSEIERVGMVMTDLSGERVEPDGPRGPVSGSPEEIADAFRAFARQGISHIAIASDPDGIEAVDRLVPVLEALASS